jgi:hypothetical protein
MRRIAAKSSQIPTVRPEPPTAKPPEPERFRGLAYVLEDAIP